MNKKNVSIALDEGEFKILDELNKELNKRSYRGFKVNRTDTLFYAIKFTSENIDILELVKTLDVRLEEVKQENETLRNLLIEFQNKINNVVS
ncbi:hypothetical protein ABES08_16950 [Peribacillus simplex]